MTIERKLLTAEELYDLPDDGFHRYELVDGELITLSPNNERHAEVTAQIGRLLGNWVWQHSLGRVLNGDPGFILQRGPDTVRAPDVCFISHGRRRPSGRPRGFRQATPDLVVEVISPSDRPAEVAAKTTAWLAAGARLVWNVYPDVEEVVVFRPDAAPRTYTHEETVDAEPVLPGFSVAVAEIFALPDEADG